MFANTVLQDLPDDCQKLIKQSGIPVEKFEENFRILLRVLHFRTGVVSTLFHSSSYMIFDVSRFTGSLRIWMLQLTYNLLNPQDSNLEVCTRSFISSRNHFVAELVTDMAELKKMYKDIDEVGKGYGVN